MRQAYRPPVQGGFGQFVDSIVLLVLVGLSLLAPLLFGSAESEAAKAHEAPPTWESLGQNPTMQAQWQKLGVRRIDGKALPKADIDAGLVDVGERKFLVYSNYDAIIAYNCAHYYALTVGLLADRLR